MSGLAYTAATRDLHTDVAFGRGADFHDDAAEHLKWIGYWRRLNFSPSVRLQLQESTAMAWENHGADRQASAKVY
jgi:hypothetical protein